MRFLLLFFVFLASIVRAEDPCSLETPCEVSEGSYYMRVPGNWNGEQPLPALIFFHGHNATGDMIFGKGGLKADFLDKGYLLIGPNGQPIEGRETRTWPARAGVGRDDVDFVLDVVEDAKARLPIDPEQVYVAGFSAGGSMAWFLACKAADRFAGFTSIAGALRQPNDSDDCPNAAVRFLHLHGFADEQVPLEGRVIRDWHQGDVFESIGLARKANGCDSNPDRINVGERFRCRFWNKSCEAGAVQLCIHDGGHGFRKGWTTKARNFMARPEG